MIIERKEKDGIITGVYKSSNISLSEYNKETKDLTITFSYGGVYTYHEVAEKDYTRFELGDSQGNILNSHIKAYPFTKGESKDKIILKEQVNEALEGEKNAFIARMAQLMNQMVKEYYANGEEVINENLLKDFDITRAHLKTL